MITLKTLPQATAQEVFDQVTQHLLVQGKAARTDSTGGCRYRAEVKKEILKCAAGCLIADEEYSSRFEGESWRRLIILQAVPSYHEDLISSLQRLHDTCLVHDWPAKLKQLAKDYGLQYNPPQPS